MEKFKIETDIHLLCVTATSFPQGVLKAHETLRSLLPVNDERKFYGISCPDQRSSIVYKAGVEQQYEGESEKLKCEPLTLKKGLYEGTIIRNFHSDTQQIGKVFQELIANPHIDPDGYCVEIYLNEKDVQCMVRLNA